MILPTSQICHHHKVPNIKMSPTSLTVISLTVTSNKGLKSKPLQKAAFSSWLKLFLNSSSSMALRIAFGETIFCMSPCDDDKKEDCILFEEFKSNSLQSRPGFAEIRIGKSRSIISSFLVVRSLTLKRKQIWSSLDFAPPFAARRQLLKQVNQRLKILTICFCYKTVISLLDFKIQTPFFEWTKKRMLIAWIWCPNSYFSTVSTNMDFEPTFAQTSVEQDFRINFICSNL